MSFAAGKAGHAGKGKSRLGRSRQLSPDLLDSAADPLTDPSNDPLYDPKSEAEVAPRPHQTAARPQGRTATSNLVKKYGALFIWGQLSGWFKQTVYDPTASLSAERRGTLSLPDPDSCYGSARQYTLKVSNLQTHLVLSVSTVILVCAAKACVASSFAKAGKKALSQVSRGGDLKG